MNTKLIMSLSAVLLGITGISLSFLPHEITASLNIPATHPLILQLIGALYFSMAMVNWTAKGNLIGGIYGRPIAIGNLTHFVMVVLTLVKYSIKHPENPLLWIATSFYLIFAFLFSYIFFTHPDLSKFSA